jgi:hypothetical protein
MVFSPASISTSNLSVGPDSDSAYIFGSTIIIIEQFVVDLVAEKNPT